VQNLSFALDIEYENAQLRHKLCISYLSTAPPVHGKVDLRVKVAVVEVEGLTPEAQGFLLFAAVEGHDATFVVHVPFLACVRLLHLVEGALEEFLVLADEQFPDMLEFALAVRC